MADVIHVKIIRTGWAQKVVCGCAACSPTGTVPAEALG
jgi:hypothetical protein